MNSRADTASNTPATATDYIAIFRRRKWVIIGVPIVAALMTYLLSARQAPLYQSTAKVSFQLATVSMANLPYDPSAYLANQAEYARSSILAQRVVDRAGVSGETAGEFLANSSADAQAGTYVLDLKAAAGTPDDARRLADAYLQEFLVYKTERESKLTAQLLRALDKRIAALPNKNGAEYDQLQLQRLQLLTTGQQMANNAQPLDNAGGGAKIRPRPTRNAVLGGLLGLVLGLGLAFLAEALDRRIKSEDEIEQALGVPLLGRVPKPPRELQSGNRLVMLADPRSIHAETFRKLRTTVEFVNLDHHARTILVTSAGPREGKSTTVANLAVALARAGRRVALVDLDLRRPSLHTYFRVRGENGITDVVVDRVSLSEALRRVALPALDFVSPNGDGTNGGGPFHDLDDPPTGRSSAEGVLHLLPCGTLPPAADEFLERADVAGVLDQLASRFEIVLVDAPPVLAVGDAMSLTAKVDAMLLVTRMGIDRRQLQELARQLQSARADVLGYILTGVAHGDSYSYGYGYDPHAYPRERRAPARRS